MSALRTSPTSRARSAPSSGPRHGSIGWQRNALNHSRNFFQVRSRALAYLSPVSTKGRQTMLNHVSIGVRDIAATRRFYDAALKPLGYSALSEGPTSLGYGKDAVALWIAVAEHPVPADQKSGLHFCFDAPTRKSVAAFHAGALGAGGHDN